MRIFKDYQGREIRLPEERESHIARRHPEVFAFDHTIGETLEVPEFVMQDEEDRQKFNYWRRYTGTNYGDKWMVVTVIIKPDDAFVASARLQTRRR